MIIVFCTVINDQYRHKQAVFISLNAILSCTTFPAAADNKKSNFHAICVFWAPILIYFIDQFKTQEGQETLAS